MPWRIAQLTVDWSENGGVASYVRDLSLALAGAGHAVHVVHADPHAPPAVGGVAETLAEHYAEYEATPRREAGARAVLAALERFRPDAVHVHGCNNFPLEAEVRRRYPTVKTLHVFDFCPTNTKYHHVTGRACTHPTGALCLPRMGYKRCLLDKRPAVIWRLYRRAADANRHNRGYRALVVASEYVRRQALASGYDAGRVRTLPYFTQPPVPPSAPARPDTVLFSGRLVREKGLHVLLAALARVPPPWRLLVAGDGMDRPRAARIANRLGVAERVTFLGWLDRAAVARCHEEAAVVAVPSLWPEPFGIVGLEAMAHARPVVAFNVGGVPEWLADGETGWLVPPSDVAALADRIAALLADPVRAAAMGAAGRARVEREFSSPAHLVRLLAIYREAASGAEPVA